MLRKVIVGILTWYKFRGVCFNSEGDRCNYKSLRSKFFYADRIVLGDDVWLGPGTELDGAGEIKIGNGVIFAPDVCVYSRTHNFDSHDLTALPFDNVVLTSRVVIGDYTWIGRGSIILPGVKIGIGAVVGAGAVVAKDVPDYAVVVGNPGKIVKYRNAKVFNQLLEDGNPFVYNKLGHKKIDKSVLKDE